MILYHMSTSLCLGDALEPDHERNAELCQPFLQALELGEDFFTGMVLNGKYLFAVLRRSGLREWADYAKWAAEAAFEYVRRTEYPHCVSRLRCNYYYDDLDACRKLYAYDWGTASREERESVHLFAVETEEERLQRFDMCLYDQAYDAMSETQDVSRVLACAGRYFAGEQTAEPCWELLSDAPARAVEDISAELHRG